MKTLGLRWKRRFLVALAVLAIAWFLHPPLLRGLAGLLVVDEPAGEFDYVAISGTEYGPSGDRCYDVAAQLCHERPARHIVVIEPYPSRLVASGILPSFESLSRRELEARGVPASTVTVLTGKARNHWQAAHMLDAWLAERPNASVLLLSGSLGSAHLRHVLDTVLSPRHCNGVRIRGLPDRRHDETNWWRSRSGLQAIIVTCLLCGYDCWRGEDQTEPTPWNPGQYEQSLRQSLDRDGR